MSNNYILSAEALISIQGSSKGAQPKYYDKGYWYKINNIGYEGLAEELVSVVENALVSRKKGLHESGVFFCV